MDVELEQLTAYWEARPYRPGVNLGSLDADLAEAEERRAATEKVSEVEGKHYSAHRSRIMALQKAGRLQEALELTERCIAASRRESRVQGAVEAPWFTERASMLLSKLGRSEEARGVLQEYVSRYPDDRSPNKVHARLEKI
ncbi:hypothetical protein [Brachybacterium saurashtrense]|uniref:Tetratrico peptide repeat group 5 domain-containing protein n=1 Tax=Brachybacterium saurashtrense TaxID=556288 RepID=A0A345YNJ4_9MICO|nr:hypothetical protein [Brachybacterium saurashtrense]AXK45496.1 hypothetical protein DWV08_07630 [Brachybacterium saurashtrense]RRR21132.1 hypothetical protein DXU92_15715 [Brachybacterium saurashtrense]